jgi:acyl dehydratase
MTGQRPTNLWFEDFQPGQRFDTGSHSVSESEIIDFAGQFDPQYYHLDPKAARASAFGGLIASGLHTLSLSFRLFFDLNIWPDAIIASPGMEHLKFLLPMRPGDRVRVAIEVLEIRPSRSKPDRGIVTMRHQLWNQDDARVLSVDCLHLVRCRPAN